MVGISALALLCASLLMVQISEGVVQIPLSRSYSVLELWKGHSSQRSSRANVEIVDDFLLVANIGFGSPKQNLNVSLDFEYYWAWVFDAAVKQSNCITGTRTRHYFNLHRSTTFHPEKASHYQDDHEGYVEECPGASEAKVVGIFGNDDIEVGHFAPTRTIFSVIQTITDGSIDPTWPADGLLGMQRPNGFENSPSSIQGLAKAAGSAEVTLFINSAGTDNAIGTLTLGGKDTVNCDANWNEFKVPTGDKGDHWENWHLRAQKIAFGTALSDANNFVLFVHINTIYVPKDAFGKITSVIGATQDATTGSYVVDCTKLSNYPDLVLTFSAGSQGVYEYHIPAIDYVSMQKSEMGQCPLLINPNDYGVWSVGIPALKSHCWMFDYDNDAISFAKVLAH